MFRGKTYRENIGPIPCCNDKRVENEKNRLKNIMEKSDKCFWAIIELINPWGGWPWRIRMRTRTKNAVGLRYLFCPTHYRRPVEHAMGSLSTFLYLSLIGVLVGVFVALITRTRVPPDTRSSIQRHNEQGDRIYRSPKRCTTRSVRDLKKNKNKRISKTVTAWRVHGLVKNMENQRSAQ